MLISSLTDKKKYNYKNFKGLYFLRWPVETEYDCWKNKLQIEIFSGHTAEAIRQDFYANIFTINLLSILIEDCEKEVKEISEGKKYEYAINRNVSIGIMKEGGKLIGLFLDGEDQIRENLIKIKEILIRYLEPIRKDRHYKRKKKITKMRGKYRHHKNYKRAI